MKKSLFPSTRTGKWSAGLTLLFLLLVLTFFACMLFGKVTFDTGHWWDLTLGIGVPVEIIAFILSIVSVKSRNEKSVLVYLSVVLGICVILFLLLHSLFIHD